MKLEFCILLLAAVANAIPDASLCVDKVPDGADPAEVGLSLLLASPACLPEHYLSLFLQLQ